MRRMILLLLLVPSALLAGDGFSTDDCSERHIRFGDDRTFVREEVVDVGRLSSLRAVSEQSPVSVKGGSAFAVTVCKAATSEALLDQIRVTLTDGVLRAEGPEGRDWSAGFRITAPDGAAVGVEARNGPVSVRDFEGSLNVRSQNGPLSLKNVGGEVDVVTSNGPISLEGGTGRMKLKASNGPLTIDLSGSGFGGGSLDAETSNGPLTLNLPRGYTSGVLVETGGGPVSCRMAECERAGLSERDGTWGRHERRTIELGSGARAVRISTVNGPVTIRESE
jgi:DUF4097 and DUF4098 domain-containing protein YvlB